MGASLESRGLTPLSLPVGAEIQGSCTWDASRGAAGLQGVRHEFYGRFHTGRVMCGGTEAGFTLHEWVTC